MNSKYITFQCGNSPFGIKLALKDEYPSLHEDTFTHAVHAEIEWHKPNDRPERSGNIITLSYCSGHFYASLLLYDKNSNSYSEISWEGLKVGVDVIAWAYPPVLCVLDQANCQEYPVEWS